MEKTIQSPHSSRSLEGHARTLPIEKLPVVWGPPYSPCLMSVRGSCLDMPRTPPQQNPLLLPPIAECLATFRDLTPSSRNVRILSPFRTVPILRSHPVAQPIPLWSGYLDQMHSMLGSAWQGCTSRSGESIWATGSNRRCSNARRS